MKSRQKKPNRLPPFVAMPWKLLDSVPYINMTYASAKLLPYLLGKPRMRFDDPEYHEVVFHFSYGEAEGLGFSRATFSRAVKELSQEGFLVKVKSGGLRGDCKSYSTYRLSREWERRDLEAKQKNGLYRIVPNSGTVLGH